MDPSVIVIAVAGVVGGTMAAVAGFGIGSLLTPVLAVAGISALFDAGARLALHGRWAIVGGILSGAFGGLVGNQGGIRSAALLPYRMERTAFVATATASALLVDLVRVPVYLVSSGREIAEAWPLVALMTVAVLVGTFAGAPILRRMPEPVFRRVVAGLIVALGLGLIAGIAG